jgi:hypothetical protein
LLAPIDTTFMKKIISALALATVSLGAAQAQTVAQPAEAKQMRFLVGMGLTFGGDQLATAHYTDGVERSIRAGSMIALNAGVDYRVTPEFSFQGTFGYHVDNASADNGGMRFERFPIELLAYYHVSPTWRLGGGARYVTSAKFKSGGAGDVGDYEFDNTLSPVVEAEYLMSAHWGFKVRLVSEKFTEKVSGAKIDGSHIGFLANYYF